MAIRSAALVLECTKSRASGIDHNAAQVRSLGRGSDRYADTVRHWANSSLQLVTDDDVPLQVGDLFDGRYELIAQLGSGTDAEVWKVRDQRRGHIVALKILAGTDEEAAWQEATRLTELKSPHILPVYNAGLAVDVPYLDTELAQLGTAKDASQPMGMPPERAVRLVRGVLRGLELRHQRRVLHRDVKPANVFLTHTGDAQLGDFGRAALMDPQGTAKAIGDPDIRAPETLKGARHNAAADVYGAGLTLYALITGDLPHHIEAAGSFPAHKANVLAGMPDIRDAAPHVSGPLARVVRKAIQMKPADRFPTAAEFDAALGALPKSGWSFQRVIPHDGHERCHEAVRQSDGHVFDVCVVPGSSPAREVVVSHRGSGNRVKALCGAGATNKAVLVRLRKSFNGLRRS